MIRNEIAGVATEAESPPVIKRPEFGDERLLIGTRGNTSAASIPLAIDAVLTADPRARGALALLLGFGAGLSYARPGRTAAIHHDDPG